VGDSAGGISEQTVTSGPEGLLTTKLHLPRPPAGFVARPRLVDRLDDGLARKLTLVSAPAGFGKTSLLADWSQRRASHVGWLSLDAGDNDPVRFWRHVAAALDRARPGIAGRVAPLLGSPGLASFEALVTTLVNELAAEPDERLLVLDDYHAIETGSVHESMSFLLEHAPPGLHVVLASRADPQFALARLRARAQLAELHAAELRFTAEEAAVLLREAVGSHLHDDAIATLTARTEGWAAGLQLAALSLRDQSDVAAFVETFSGSHRYVLDYLTEEVLERQPEPVRVFLLETSVLDRLSGPLCDAVTDRTDSQAMLETIERANLFLVPLDEVRGWWRNHQLFADLLRARLQQDQPGRVFQLHRNAARWHDEHGLIDDAVRHGIAAGDVVWAARLVERHADALLLRGEETTLQRWLAALPPKLADSRPRLLLAQTTFVLLEENENLLDAAERAFALVADEPYEPSVGRGTSRLANVPAMIAARRAFVAFLRGDGEAAMSFASQALTEVSEDEWMLESLARAQLGSAEWLCGRLEAAESTIASSIERWRAAGARDLVTLWWQYLGRIQCAQGRLDRALGTYQRALDLSTAPGQPTLAAAGAALVGMAEVAYQRGELDTATQHLTEGLALCRQFVIPDALDVSSGGRRWRSRAAAILVSSVSVATGSATLAWVRQARGDATGALDAMAQGERTADPSMSDMLNPVPAQRARLLLAQGDIDAAAQWTAERALSADDEPSYAKEPAYLVLARVLVAQEQPIQALALLGRLHASATGQDRIGSVIEIQALRALALRAGGDETGAVATLTEALTLAQPQGYVRVFVDEGPPMAALLGTLLAAQRTEPTSVGDVPVDYLGLLVRAFAQDGAGDAADMAPSRAHVPGLVIPLSERELEVLRLLAAGEQNQEIADQLYLALNTVKKHVTHILEKLGAANRTEAAARARQLGLLP
jgi:LuxR family transcriptional regulator, maltose regulon positive regulatory protein